MQMKKQIKNVNPTGSSHATTRMFLVPGGVYYFSSSKGLKHL